MPSSTASSGSGANGSGSGGSGSGSGSGASVAVAVGAQNEINSVRELNRLLESALRMGNDEYLGNGDEAPSSSSSSSSAAAAAVELSPHGDGSHAATNSKSASSSGVVGGDAASWRLDTARRLSSVSSNIHAQPTVVKSCCLDRGVSGDDFAQGCSLLPIAFTIRMKTHNDTDELLLILSQSYTSFSIGKCK